ncbi:glutamine-hydrolyzing GMP synthase [Candidatus Saccharibacteria bacterium]|nr:glutamine-hydrolyzing GMP synthase [Candidatus Saccharibacteria bacterium]
MDTAAQNEVLVILDYGSQYTQLIARRTRELGVFSLILPHDTTLAEIKTLKPKGLILSGGPSSVYETGAPKLDMELLKLNIPILGICYGLQLLALNLGGEVKASDSREYGLAKLRNKAKSWLIEEAFDGSQIWMSHGDHVAVAPKGFEVTAQSGNIICAAENQQQKLFGLQFHPEVTHTEFGRQILKNFLKICGFKHDWTPKSFVDSEIDRIQKLVGNRKVICALSGGVDSSVAASLVSRAIGDRQICIFVDTGLLREGEYQEVLAIYKAAGLNVKPIKAAERFLSQLKSITDPESKRKIIGGEFINIFETEAKLVGDVKFLVQGTLYPDVIESVSVHGPSATIKSHHNVGGLPKTMNLELLEPLRELFKDEVRQIGKRLGLPNSITQRQPFPGPGLAVRIIGEVTPESVSLLQAADQIVRDEITKSGAHTDLWQYFAVLLPVQTVGVMGDQRTYDQVIAIRAVESTDGMTADWAKLPHDLLAKISNRIVREVKGVNRVVYDITSKPPGTIEWE